MRGTSCVTSEGTMLIGEQKEEEAGEQVLSQHKDSTQGPLCRAELREVLVCCGQKAPEAVQGGFPRTPCPPSPLFQQNANLSQRRSPDLRQIHQLHRTYQSAQNMPMGTKQTNGHQTR